MGDTDKLLGKIMNTFRMDVTDGSIYHTFEATMLMVPSSCGHCHVRLKGMGSKAMKCKACGEKWCEECIKFEEPCETKVQQEKENEERKAAEEEEERAEEEALKSMASSDSLSHSTVEDMKHRFHMFTKYWKVSGEVLKTIMHIDGLSAASHPDKFLEVISIWVKKQSHGYVEALIDQIPGILKYLWEEPDMPEFVKKFKDKFVDMLWGEIQEEILYNFKVVLDGEKYISEEHDERKGVDCIRSRIRHSLLPYDRTIWWQVSDPIWLIFFLLPLIPWAAVVPTVFLVIFILIDKRDEFQLVQFILRFKGVQFITHGVIRNLIGFYSYWACVTDFDPKDKYEPGLNEDHLKHSCATTGPGNSQGLTGLFHVFFGGWLLMISLTYIAYALLPCSIEKGRRQLNTDNLVDDEDRLATDIAAGGSLRYLAVYDFFCFLLCLSVLLFVMWTRDWEADWVVSQSFFAVQVVYGYMAFPFFFINLPLCKTILTHSVRTGYDTKGRIRAFEGPGRKDPEVLKAQYKALEAKQREWEGLPAIEDEVEADDGLFARIKGIIAEIFHVDFSGGGKDDKDDAAAGTKEDEGPPKDKKATTPASQKEAPAQRERGGASAGSGAEAAADVGEEESTPRKQGCC